MLNHPRYAGASVLIAGRNFGRGSSREHAPWALAEYGIRSIIAPYFADIFTNNSAKNGILLVPMAEEQVAELMRRAKETHGYRLTVDLEQCEVRDELGFRTPFSVDPFHRRCLLEGLDDIDLTLQHEAHIAAHEAQKRLS